MCNIKFAFSKDFNLRYIKKYIKVQHWQDTINHSYMFLRNGFMEVGVDRLHYPVMQNANNACSYSSEAPLQ